jgi:hypothetical protein
LPTKRTQLAEQRILEALGTGRIRRFRVQRRLYERDTRLDVDAARMALDRHHRSELALSVDVPPSA